MLNLRRKALFRCKTHFDLFALVLHTNYCAAVVMEIVQYIQLETSDSERSCRASINRKDPRKEAGQVLLSSRLLHRDD